MSAVALLNSAIDAPSELCSVNDARDALRRLELWPLAIGALRVLVKHPDNKDAIAHAQRCIDHMDNPPFTHPAPADFSDLA